MEPRLPRMNSLTGAGLSEDIELPADKERIPFLWVRLQSSIGEITNRVGPAMGVVSRSGKPRCARFTAYTQESPA